MREDRNAIDRLLGAYRLLDTEDGYRFHRERLGSPESGDEAVNHLGEQDPVGVLTRFRSAVAGGVFPDIGALLFVANRFAAYLEKKGELTLDEVFNLKPKKRVGSPLQRQEKKREEEDFLFRMAAHRAKNPRASLAQAAEAVCTEHEKDDENLCDRMVRYYQLEGWRKLEKWMQDGRIRIEPYPPSERK